MKKLFLGNRVFPLPITVIAALALGAALNLGSCAIGAVSPAGSTVKLAYSAAARASAPVSGSSSTEARVWVYSNNIPVANPNGQAYFSGTVDSNGGTVTISALYPGDNYLFVAAAGTNNGTTFTTTAFGTSGQFSIKAGVETTVSITLDPISITPYLSGTNVVSVASVGSTVYAASANTLYSGSSFSGNPWNYGTVNNLNATDDGSTLLVSTSTGVFGSTGTAIGASLAVNVLQAAGAGSEGPFFYQADKEFGGYTGTTWTQIALDLPVAGRPILDMLVVQDSANNVYAIAATRVVGAFMMSSAFINSSDHLQEIFSGNSTYLTFFGSDLPLIQALGKAPNGIYAGTKNGAYQITLNSADLPGSLKTAVPALIPGTTGLDITKVLVDSAGNAVFLASSELVLFYNATKRIYKMPFLTGAVGTLRDVACDTSNIYVAGSNGLVSFPIPTP